MEDPSVEIYTKEAEVRDDIREKLIQIARSQDLVSYDGLNKQLDLGLDFTSPPDRNLIGDWLGEISEYKVRAGRHMLSAIVVHREGEGFGDPGKGFYEYARELGAYQGGDDLGFWAKEVKWLHDYWRSH